MATLIRDLGARPPQRGFRFEDEVAETLERGLPDTYTILQNPVLSLPPQQAWGKRIAEIREREVDSILVGPNGLFLLECKWKDSVDGDLFGLWAYRSKRGGKVTAQEQKGEKPGLNMKVKLAKADEYVRKRGKQHLHKYALARAIFVFPDHCKALIYDAHGKPKTSFLGTYWIATLSDLVPLIQRLPGPSFRQGAPPAKLSPADASDLIALFRPGRYADPQLAGDYRIVSRSPPRTASNGLEYVDCVLEHLSLPLKRRAKWYDLELLRARDRKTFEEQVKRHAEVLARVGSHRNILTLHEYRTDAIANGYWVIQEYIAGRTLAELLPTGLRQDIPLKPFMLQIADALHALHRHDFVRRELNPSSILVEEGTWRPVLTDFELAKSTRGLPTVTTDAPLPKDPYRAPEVEGDRSNIDPRADMYSWAAIFVHLATGEVAADPGCGDALRAAGVPPGVSQLVEKCLRPCDDRPLRMAAILKVVQSWR